MNRELILEYSPDLIRAAIIEDGQLCEIHRERIGRKKLTDSLFYGRVQSIRPSVGAAFVDIGEPLNAFLPLSNNSRLKCGDYLIVQGVAVQAVESKGLRVSDTINLAGKWLVLIPGGNGVRMSKKIKDADIRRVLTDAVEPLCPADCGIIVRTASADITAEVLGAEIQELYDRWQQIVLKAKGMAAPGVLYEPVDLAGRLIRDIGNTLTRVVSNDYRVVQELELERDKGKIVADAVIELFSEKSSLLNDVYAIDAHVDKALKKRVWLDCGGYLVFDACEALTVIDVNSGKMMLGSDSEETALRVNLEAAQEIARQLRLRDIGGIVVVDYIDMKSSEHREHLLQKIRSEASRDRSQVTVGGVTRFGLVEMTRKRKGEQLDKSLLMGCKSCNGSGRCLSAEEAAFRALRQISRMMLAGQRGPYLIRCTAQTAAVLGELTAPNDAQDIFVLGEKGRGAERFEINQMDITALPPDGALRMKKVKQ